MVGSTHEQTPNTALGEVLDGLRRSWRARAEQTGDVFEGGGRPDILVEDASGWPVVIEAERASYPSAEQDAVKRLGRKVRPGGRAIETAIALVYPEELTHLDGASLREAIHRTDALEYALYTRREGLSPERLPEQGWIRGSVRDLAILVHRAAAPAPRVEALAGQFEYGVEAAATAFTNHHDYGSDLGKQIADVLRQDDDENGQTRRMAMTVLANALIFHEALAEAEVLVVDGQSSAQRAVRGVSQFAPNNIFNKEDLRGEWERILGVNYWPIFGSASAILEHMPIATAASVLAALWRMAEQLVGGGVTRSHDLTGIVFQRLIADRKFLATYYTRPEAAALLVGLAMPADRPLGGADWGDGETLAGLQIGDFACGTGTLLSTAYQRLSLLHELHGGDPHALHGPMMKHGLVGLDVLNIAVHPTAAMLAGSHPGTPFDGECLLTMPYGDIYVKPNGNGNGNGRPKQAATVGSLDLLAENVQPGLVQQAAAVTSGGRAPEEVRDLMSRVGHGKFDLIVMNPPFTRPTGIEGKKKGTGNPAFAAFQTPKPVQRQMQAALVDLRGKHAIASGNTGLAADFLELSLRKSWPDGTIALVLPLSATSGIEWEAARQAVKNSCTNVIVVTIAGAGSHKASFSADTGMAECLLIARRGHPPRQSRATFVVLRQQVRTSQEAELLAAEIVRLRESGEIASIERLEGGRSIVIGEQEFGIILDAPLPESGRWPIVGVADDEIAEAAWRLDSGKLMLPHSPTADSIELPIVPIGQIANRGPYHADISWNNTDGSPRGPFSLRKLPPNRPSNYPILWAHDAKRERRLVVAADRGGIIRARQREKAVRIWASATRAHYNRDLRFNSQSLIVVMTEHPCIGGAAWPSVIFENPEHEYGFALWCNSTLGLLLHWWASNKTQSGRGITTITTIPKIPALDTRALTAEQHAAAKAAFDAMRELRFLPFDQIDEDPARAELDRRLLVDVLGLPESLCAENGPIDLLRRKLAREPQIHGGKKTRVVFGQTTNARGDALFSERTERRTDR